MAAGAGGRKQPGQHRRIFQRDQALRLRAESISWRKIAAELGARGHAGSKAIPRHPGDR
jgi:hypothetical protein